MSTTLHILNGDTTLTGFEQTGLDGDILVWREVLSEGPLSDDVSSATFWEKRVDWICNTFNETPERYNDGVIAPLEKLSLEYEEINMWFEFDLHCQLNLLGVMELLNRQTNLNKRAIYLICPADFAGKDNFKGMGELSGDELAYLYDNIRVRLNEYDFTLAAEAWSIYVSNNTDHLSEWLNKTTFWGSLHLLQPAMQAQLKRLQFNSEGLNDIHQKLLAIYNSGTHTRAAVHRAFWDAGKIYGMGDSEIDLYLQQLIDKRLIQIK